MKKKISYALSVVVLLFVAILAACVCTGCGPIGIGLTGREQAQATDQKLALGIVLANRADFPEPDYDALKPYLTDFIDNGGMLCLSVSDSTPEVITYPSDGIESGEKNAVNRLRNERLAKAIGVLRETVADSGDAAILESVIAVAKNLSSCEAGWRRQLVVVDNGLQTARSFGFANVAPGSCDPEKTAEKLAEQLNIPPLEGVPVTWLGMGNAPYSLYPEGIPQIDVQKLTEIWQAVLTRGGAASVTFGELSTARDPAERNLPECRRITVSDQEDPVVTTVAHTDYHPEETYQTETNVLSGDGAIKLEERTIRFVPDSTDQLIDPGKAAQDLRQLADIISAYNKPVLLIGTIACVGNSQDGGVSFSRKRAETIRRLLVENGVRKELLLTAGAGYLDKRLLEEETDDEAKARNRAVWVIAADSEKNSEVVRDYYQP